MIRLEILLHRLSLLGLVALLSLAPTWPEDDKGRPAGQCSFIGSSGAPTLCSATDPLPSAPVTTSTTDPSGWAKTVFVSSATTPRPGAPFYQTDLTVIAVRANAGGTGLELLNSSDGGVSFSSTVQTVQGTLPHTSVGANASMPLTIAAGTYILGVQAANPGATGNWTAATSPLWTSANPGSGWAGSTGTGGFTSQINSVKEIAVQGSTILATLNGTPATDSRICRSTDSGATWTCVNPAPTFIQVSAGGLASPALGIWLAIDGAGPRNVIRSTDDGVTWTAITTLTGTGEASANQNIVCISSTVCLATANRNIYRSTDAGLTWSLTAVLDTSGTACSGGLISFGQGVLLAHGNCGAGAVTTEVEHRSADSGVSWTRMPDLTLGGASIGTLLRSAVRNGRSVSFHDQTTQSIVYTPVLTGPVIQAANGNRLDIDPFGAARQFLSDGAGVRQGSTTNPVATTPRQGATLFNTQTTSAANTAQTVAITGSSGLRSTLRGAWGSISAAGTCTVTIQDGATTILTLPALTSTTVINLFPNGWVPASGISASTNNALNVVIGACGVGVTSTVAVIGDRQ